MINSLKLTLKAARINKGLSQKQAAQALGIAEDTLSNYERGKSYPDIKILRLIEKVYGVEYNNLIFLPLDNDNFVNKTI